jgi:hypothetical protein
MYLPDEGKYETFYRTNIDRRTSLFPKQRRRERAVGRSECTTFGEWGEHELAMRSDVDLQNALGYGKQDYYQLQAWPCADAYLGIVSVFYWEEDVNHLELAWSPDTIYWERVCPYTDIVPHGDFGDFEGGNRYASMRPREVDGEVRVYFGADNGRHNADSGTRDSTLLLALFEPDRFAGLAPVRGGKGSVTTFPLEVRTDALTLNVHAPDGEVRVEIQDEAGAALDDFSLDACSPVGGDSLDARVSWKGGEVASLKGRRVRLRFELEEAVLYTFGV